MVRRPPILLGNAGWTGTLAASRLLGRHGIPVTVTSHERFSHTRFSRHVDRFVRSPAYDGDGFIDWLVAFGREHPGYVLYPTSDSLAFLYALHADALSRHFRLSVPSLDTLVTVLDKKRLYAAANAAGVRTPETRFPESHDEVAALADFARGGVVVKPRTQTLTLWGGKGSVVNDGAALLRSFDDVRRESRFGRAVLEHMPSADRPMVQRYYADASEHIYLLAGYADDSRGLFVTRASLKLLQWPRRLGVGLCFEEQPVIPELEANVREMLRRMDYRGLFQIEFVRSGDQHLLIDFNPRFYLPLAFEIARGMPLPLMVYAEAIGDYAWLERLVADARTSPGASYGAFCNGVGLHLLLAAQGLSGRMPSPQIQKWRRWYASTSGRRLDSHADAGDPLPSVIFAANELYGVARHPRYFYRRIFLDA
ncbi:MAG TPA: hypothetical protein VHE30_02425 [Polyangiaceae bacterium]|nr:hypothetical protein [Polyangiaceae bacterium]